MSNYKTITDTGPYTFSPSIIRLQQAWPHGPTAFPGKSNHPPGSPPTENCDKHSPPSFFERGNKIRWLLLFLPFAISKYIYKEISPFDLPDDQFYKFYIIYFICSALTTHLALNAKRRALSNLLHDTDDLPYHLSRIKEAYNNWTNTTIVPLLCIATGFARFVQQVFIQQDAQLPLISTAIVALIFMAIFRANNYNNSYNAIYKIAPPWHIHNLMEQERDMLIRMGALGLTAMWYYDNMVAWGLMEPWEDDGEQQEQFTDKWFR